MNEVRLEELIIQFDGTVVELFNAGRGDSFRYHVAQLERAQLLRLDSRKGPTFELVGRRHGGVALTNLKIGPGELEALQAITQQIDAAIPR